MFELAKVRIVRVRIYTVLLMDTEKLFAYRAVFKVLPLDNNNNNNDNTNIYTGIDTSTSNAVINVCPALIKERKEKGNT